MESRMRRFWNHRRLRPIRRIFYCRRPGICGDCGRLTLWAAGMGSDIAGVHVAYGRADRKIRPICGPCRTWRHDEYVEPDNPVMIRGFVLGYETETPYVPRPRTPGYGLEPVYVGPPHGMV